jgi:hypothetical protein
MRLEMGRKRDEPPRRQERQDKREERIEEIDPQMIADKEEIKLSGTLKGPGFAYANLCSLFCSICIICGSISLTRFLLSLPSCLGVLAVRPLW